MKQMCKRSIGIALTAVFLSACSSEKREGPSFPRQLAGAIQEVAASRNKGPLPKSEVSPEDFAKITVPLLQVNPEIRGGSDFLQRVARRNDSSPGTLDIWESSDKAQIFLREGVVVGSRGIGGDIIAAGANSTVNALSRRVDGSGVRKFVVSDGDVTTTTYEFRCDVVNLGPDVISVANQRFTSIHMQETCTVEDAGTQVISNDYWVHPSSGIVRKSRQWMGPRIGYFELLVLK